MPCAARGFLTAPAARSAIDAAHAEIGVFHNHGSCWGIRYEGKWVWLPDAKGLRYLASLLASPHQPIAAVRLFRRSENACLEPAAERERARSAVTKRIKEAIRRIAAHHPTLGYHLGTAVRTGKYCSYQPDPSGSVDWGVTPADEE